MSLNAMAHLVRNYPGGLPAVALLLNKAPGTLRAELAPPVGSSAKLGWLDAVAIMEFAQSVGSPLALTPLDMVEAAFGRMALALPPMDQAPADLLRDSASMTKAFADFLADVSSTLADGKVTANELKQLNADGLQLMACLQTMLQHLAQHHEAGKPAHERADGLRVVA